MSIILRNEHYIDSPADVIVLETSTRFHNRLDSVNGTIKDWFPGVYTCGKGLTARLRQGSVVPLSAVNFPHKLSFSIAAVCVYSPAMKHIRPHEYMNALESLISWFWSQDEFESIGMNLLCARAKCLMNVNSVINDHLTLWEKYRAKRLDRELYLHSVESSFLAPVKMPKWDGKFMKAQPIWRSLFPNLES